MLGILLKETGSQLGLTRAVNYVAHRATDGGTTDSVTPKDPDQVMILTCHVPTYTPVILEWCLRLWT